MFGCLPFRFARDFRERFIQVVEFIIGKILVAEFLGKCIDCREIHGIDFPQLIEDFRAKSQLILPREGAVPAQVLQQSVEPREGQGDLLLLVRDDLRDDIGVFQLLNIRGDGVLLQEEGDHEEQLEENQAQSEYKDNRTFPGFGHLRRVIQQEHHHPHDLQHEREMHEFQRELHRVKREQRHLPTHADLLVRVRFRHVRRIPQLIPELHRLLQIQIQELLHFNLERTRD